MLLQMILDSRGLLNAESDGVDDVIRGMDTVPVDAGSGDRSVPEAAGKSVGKRKATKKNTSGKTATKPSLHGAVFAQRMGVIFSAMYNMSVDADTLKMVHEVAGTLAGSAASSAEWASTEIGQIVRFADDRSQDRVHEFFYQLHRPWAAGARSVRQDTAGEDSFCLRLHGRRHQARDLVSDHGSGFVLPRKGIEAKATMRRKSSWWKLRPERLQDEFGKLAPRVTTHLENGAHSGPGGPKVANAVRQNVWFGTALEELAQMCGAFLAATSTSEPTATPHLDITMHVGDALNLCDALLTGSPSLGAAEDCTTSAVFAPISLQPGSVQPLHLRAGICSCPPQYDVINTCNLAEHLVECSKIKSTVNVLVASSPLLKTLPHAVLLTSLLASTATLYLYDGLADFQAKLLCMSSHTAEILLAVVPVSSLSSVVGHTDTMASLSGTLPTQQNVSSGSASTQVRLTWKRPSPDLTSPVPPAASVDISPSEFASLTLPVYEAVFFHMPNMSIFGIDDKQLLLSAATNKYYTSVSFARVLALFGRRLRLGAANFEAARVSIFESSGLVLALNLRQEQTLLHHSTRSDFVVDHSIELIRDFGMIEGFGLVYEAILRMADDGARDVLATGGAAVDEKVGGLCSVCVKLGGRFVHFTHFLFPVKKGAVNLKVCKRQGHAIFTVPPSGSPAQIPDTALGACRQAYSGHRKSLWHRCRGQTSRRSGLTGRSWGACRSSGERRAAMTPPPAAWRRSFHP
ncbi:unnamed protein product, partial [Ectocarpus sp. 13 AM-2016]